jgi:hypothetical protein
LFFLPQLQKIPAALTNARRMLIGDENRRLSTRGALYARTWSQAVREKLTL